MNLKGNNKFKIEYELTEKNIANVIGCSKPTLLTKKNKNLFTLEDINKINKKFNLSSE